MSLVTATAFQVSPTIQFRAFVVLGELATAEVDDDFFYQMLVAFRSTLMRTTDSTISVVSMLRCIRNVVPALQPGSRYLGPIFWLAVALLQFGHMAFYVEASQLLCVAIQQLSDQGLVQEHGVPESLLEHRYSFRDIADQLDRSLKISFETNFSFSIAAIIIKGLKFKMFEPIALEALRTMLRVSSRTQSNADDSEEVAGHCVAPDSLGYFLALLPAATTRRAYRELLQDANLDDHPIGEDPAETVDDEDVPCVPLELLNITNNNSALLVISFIGVMLEISQGENPETEIYFRLLSDVSMAYPEVLTIWLVHSSLFASLAHTQNKQLRWFARTSERSLCGILKRQCPERRIKCVPHRPSGPEPVWRVEQLNVHVGHCRRKRDYRGSDAKSSFGRDKHGRIEHRLPLHIGQQDECDGTSRELDSGTCSTNNGMKESNHDEPLQLSAVFLRTLCCYPCCCITAFIFFNYDTLLQCIYLPT